MTYTDKQRQAYLYFFNELRLCIEFPDRFIPKLKALMVLGFPIDFQNGFGDTLLLCAMSRPLAVTRGIHSTLIELGADVNLTNQSKHTPLQEGVYYRCPVNVIEQLISAGAKVNTRDISGMTPFGWAAQYAIFGVYDNNNINYGMEAAKVLLEHGAQPYLYDDWSRPYADDEERERLNNLRKLCEAYQFKRQEISMPTISDLETKNTKNDVEIRVEMHDLCQSSYSELKAMMSTAKERFARPQCFLETFENTLKAAIAAGYSINYKDEESGDTLLNSSLDYDYAVDSGIPDMLLDYGACPNIYDIGGYYTLDWAIGRMRPLKLIEHLISAGAEVNAVDFGGLTAFNSAALMYIYCPDSEDQQYALDVVKLLMEHDADPYLCTKWLETENGIDEDTLVRKEWIKLLCDTYHAKSAEQLTK